MYCYVKWKCTLVRLMLTLIVQRMYAINCFTVTVAVYYPWTSQYCSLSILVNIFIGTKYKCIWESRSCAVRGLVYVIGCCCLMADAEFCILFGLDPLKLPLYAMINSSTTLLCVWVDVLIMQLKFTFNLMTDVQLCTVSGSAAPQITRMLCCIQSKVEQRPSYWKRL